MGVALKSYRWLNSNSTVSRFSELKILIVTGCGVCFVQGVLVFVKLIFKVG